MHVQMGMPALGSQCAGLRLQSETECYQHAVAACGANATAAREQGQHMSPRPRWVWLAAKAALASSSIHAPHAPGQKILLVSAASAPLPET